MNKNRQLYVAAYDISSPARLRRALEFMRQFSSGGQKSVFECYLTEAEFDEILERMDQILDHDLDRFLIFSQPQPKQIICEGIAIQPQDGDFFYLS